MACQDWYYVLLILVAGAIAARGLPLGPNVALMFSAVGAVLAVVGAILVAVC